MSFEDELNEIVRKQARKNFSEEEGGALETVIGMIEAPGTYGYLVFVTADGDNGLIVLGDGPTDMAELSFAHRLSDNLINERLQMGDLTDDLG